MCISNLHPTKMQSMAEARRCKLRDFARRRQRVYLEMQSPISPRSAHRLMFWRSMEQATYEHETIQMAAWAELQRFKQAKAYEWEAVAIQLRNAEARARAAMQGALP